MTEFSPPWNSDMTLETSVKNWNLKIDVASYLSILIQTNDKT